MSQRNYPMNCVSCPSKALFYNLNDAYSLGWKSCTNGEHCPKHVTKDDFNHDHDMRCAHCNEEGLFEDLDDAIEFGWWTIDEWDFCPDCAPDIIEQQRELEDNY